MSNRPKAKSPSAAQKRVTTARGRTVAAQRRQATRSRTTWIVVGVAVVVLVALIVAIVVAQSGSSNKAGTVAADPTVVVGKVVAVDDSTISTVGSGSSANLPTAISAPPLTKDGKPLVLYVGAEYCPFCAAQRWAVVQALSRFGTFTGLTLTHSDPKDAYPNTPTFTFHGATYTSSVVAFEGVETQTVDHQPLDTLTSDQGALFTKYNAPPYVPASAQGAIPFIYFGGSYLLSGASYSPQTLQGMTADEVADALADPEQRGRQGHHRCGQRDHRHRSAS